MFTTPRLLENLAERMSLVKAGLKGVFAGGTTMTPQYVRFVVEEVLEGRINFAPTYGNTLMGLAISRKLKPEDNYSLTYYAPQPRAVLGRQSRQALPNSSPTANTAASNSPP
jgi:ATP-dependent phosphoenolpyruvate carboxykinase